MRTLHKATLVMIATALAFSVSACSGTSAKPGAGATPTGAVKTIKRAPVVNPVPNQATQPATADRMVTGDLLNMARMQDGYIKAHHPKKGFAVTASTAGKPLTINTTNDFPTMPGNVVAVTVDPDGYCISVYNKYASKANKATSAALFKSAAGGLQKTLGRC